MINRVIYPFLSGYVELVYDESHITNIICKEQISKTDTTLPHLSNVPDFVYDAHRQISEYSNGTRKCFDIPYVINGTEFQIKVWKALLNIPYGEIATYKDIAEAIGSPKSYRAVGMANNKNPINIVIPCHRIIGSNGNLVGYAGGLKIKKELLELEKYL